MHDFRRPRPCCTHGCFPPLEPILSPTSDFGAAKSCSLVIFIIRPPTATVPVKITPTIAAFFMAKLLNRTLTRSLRTPFISTPSHRRSITPTCYDPFAANQRDALVNRVRSLSSSFVQTGLTSAERLDLGAASTWRKASAEMRNTDQGLACRFERPTETRLPGTQPPIRTRAT